MSQQQANKKKVTKTIDVEKVASQQQISDKRNFASEVLKPKVLRP